MGFVLAVEAVLPLNWNAVLCCFDWREIRDEADRGCFFRASAREAD
jgi:hypothetical protein